MKKLLLICCLFIAIATVSRAQNKAASAPVEKAKSLQKQLKLSDKQTEKVSEIYKESVKKFDEIKVKEHGNTNKMLAAVAPLRESTIKKIKEVLTPKQTVKYDKLVKDNKNANLNSGWSDGWTSGK
jgi:Spy/CpxP family protein refolding chaperone